MSEKNKKSEFNKQNDGYCSYQGGYISYDPNALTEHYTVKGFEGKIENKQISKSKWC